MIVMKKGVGVLFIASVAAANNQMEEQSTSLLKSSSAKLNCYDLDGDIRESFTDYVPQLPMKDISYCNVSGTWILYDEENYTGSTSFWMYGYKNLVKLPTQFRYKNVSVRFAGAPDDWKASSINIYSQELFMGQEDFSYDDIPQFKIEASSIIITGCEPWTVFPETNYQGSSRCLFPSDIDKCTPGLYPTFSSFNKGAAGRVLSAQRGCNDKDSQKIKNQLGVYSSAGDSGTLPSSWNPFDATESGLLVAGGQDGQYSYSDIVEMINLKTMSSCIVDVKLDQPRRYHTGDGDLVCGGVDDDNWLSSCYNIVTGTTINLNNGRFSHLSWSISNGQEIYLLGGQPTSSSWRTTELIMENSTQQPSFELQYSTRYACGFADEDDDTYIITGGAATQTTVSRYDTNGWIEDLPSLNTGRWNHGCGTFADDDNKIIYLVTGGYGGNYHSSTEMMVKGATSWTEVPDSLPARMSRLASISIDNQIITSGGWDFDAKEYSDKILMFNKETRKFEQIGKLEQRRGYHSMSLVRLSDYKGSFQK